MNYHHHVKNQPHQEVEDSYIFVNIFAKKQYGYYTSNILWYSIKQAHSNNWTY